MKRFVDRKTWLDARRALLARETALVREREALAAQRRRLPMVRVDKLYSFESVRGREALYPTLHVRR